MMNEWMRTGQWSTQN